MVKYELVNPCILGQFNTTYETPKAIDAAKQFWNDLTPHLTNNIPQIAITLKDHDGHLSHFKIKEKLSEGTKMANFTIKEINPKLSVKNKRELLNAVDELKQKKSMQIKQQLGGRKKRYDTEKESSTSISSESTKSATESTKSTESDSDSSSDEDDDYFNFRRYNRISQPIVYWHYTPSIYQETKLFIPTFNNPLTPYVHIWTP
jgi:phage/plasmid primase-like uncharacterized protein